MGMLIARRREREAARVAAEQKAARDAEVAAEASKAANAAAEAARVAAEERKLEELTRPTASAAPVPSAPKTAEPKPDDESDSRQKLGKPGKK